MKTASKTITVCTVIVLISIISLFGCNGGTLNTNDSDLTSGFRLGFGLIRDIGMNRSTGVADFRHNDSIITDAVITAGNDTLPYLGSQYLLEKVSVDSIPAGSILITTNWNSFSDITTLTAPANFAIASVLPPVKGPGDRVFVDWNGSAGAETYVIAAVKQDSAYIGIGFSQYVTSLSTSETIDDSAFTITTLQGAEPNPGIYNIYIYALNGSPDSALSSLKLPVPLPSQLTANVTKPDYKAFSGLITVSAPVTVEVVASP